MSTLIQPIALLAIILTGYLFKRAGKFKNRDYRIMQVALFNPGSALRHHLLVRHEPA